MHLAHGLQGTLEDAPVLVDQGQLAVQDVDGIDPGLFCQHQGLKDFFLCIVGLEL